MSFLTNDSTQGRSWRTSLQAFIGAVIGLITGLIVVVWNVPGVPTVVINYTQQHLIELILAFGIPTSIASWIVTYIMNLLRDDVAH